MEIQGLPGLAALVELPALSAPVSIRAAFNFLLKTIGVPKDTPRASLPQTIPASAAVSVLQLLAANLPDDVSLHDAAAALCPTGVHSYQHDLQAQLDALLGLSCLLSSGSTQDKLQLCFWTLDRDSSGSLDLQQVLGLIPAAQRAAAAARVLLQDASLQTLAQEAADPRAAADTQQGCAMLREVLSRAFVEADPQGTGLIQPGEQLTQLLFAAAAQLTSMMVGATSLSREGTAFGSSRASSTSTTPPRSTSASPFRLHQPSSDRQLAQQQQTVQLAQPPHASSNGRHHQLQVQQEVVASHLHSTPPTPGAAAQQRAVQGAGTGDPRSAADMADVLIMDKEGGVLHYQTSVDQAAAAACMGRAPVAPQGGGELHVYEPHASRGNSRQSLISSGSGGNQQQQQQQGLAPARSSLLQQLEILEAKQQQQQQQPHQPQPAAITASDHGATTLFLTPDGTVSAEGAHPVSSGSGDGGDSPAGAGSSSHSPFIKHMQHHRVKQVQQQQPGSPGNSLRRMFLGSPFGTISESVNAGITTDSAAEAADVKSPESGGGTAGEGQDGTAPATAAGAITHTATNVMSTVQANVIAVVVKLLLHCGMCFLLTMMVALGDAAIVTGLHMGAHLALSVSFAVAVAANMALVLLLVGMLVVARLLNARSNSRLAEAANSPEAQQLDQVLETMKAVVQALKTTEQQQQQQQAGVALRQGSVSNRFTGSHFLASRASSRQDIEQGRSGGGAPGGAQGAGGAVAVAGKLRAVWSAVGKVAGFLPPQESAGSDPALAGGPFGSAVQLEPGAAGQAHSSTSWGASSEGVNTAPAGASQGASAAAAGGRVAGAGAGQGPRPPSPQGRQQRVVGTSAPQSAAGAAPVALKEAYPQL